MSKKNPIQNQKLVDAIIDMQEDNNPANVNKMIECLMEAQLITPARVSKSAPVAKNNGTGTVMQQQTQVQFLLIENQNKEKFFPAFTDKEEKDKWELSADKQEVIMTFDTFAQVLSAPDCDVCGFVINPFGRSVAFPKDMILSLKQQKDSKKTQETQIKHGQLQHQEITADEKVELSDPDPDEYPIDMMASIINYLQERDDVNSAYLKMFKRENQEKPSYLIIVDFEGDKMAEIFKGISTFANPHLGGIDLSMMPYSFPFAKKAVEDIEPFFEKE